MTGILDFGTTNVKLYLCEGEQIVQKTVENVGIKDFSNNIMTVSMEDYICDLLSRSLEKLGKTMADLRRLICFGMITAETGLKEVPHLTAPASLEQMKESVFEWKDQTFLPEHVQVLMIRGVKKPLYQGEDMLKRLEIDFMRGEETQCIGVLKKLDVKEAVNVVVLSSHTKLIHINDRCEIADSITTLTGQLFDLLQTRTIVGKSIRVPKEKMKDITDAQIDSVIELADKLLEGKGFSRCMMLPRFMELFTDMTDIERLCYVDAVLALEDVRSLSDFLAVESNRTNLYCLVGHDLHCRVYGRALRRAVGEAPKIVSITDDQDLSVMGALEITSRVPMKQA